MREDFVIALRVLLKKLTEIYNTATKIQKMVTEICDYDERVLAKLVETESNNPHFILWKNYLGFRIEKSEVNSYKKLSLLQTNYEHFISNYGMLLGNDGVEPSNVSVSDIPVLRKKENKISKKIKDELKELEYNIRTRTAAITEANSKKSAKYKPDKKKSIYEGIV